MPPHPNFTFRDKHDPEAASIAVAAILKTLIMQSDIRLDRERVHQLIQSAAGEDMDIVARAEWYVQWMTGNIDAEGEDL